MFEHLLPVQSDSSFIAATITSRLLLVLAIAFALTDSPPERAVEVDLSIWCFPDWLDAYEPQHPPQPPPARLGECPRYRRPSARYCAEACHLP
jgi:hypothetical protein